MSTSPRNWRSPLTLASSASAFRYTTTGNDSALEQAIFLKAYPWWRRRIVMVVAPSGKAKFEHTSRRRCGDQTLPKVRLQVRYGSPSAWPALCNVERCYFVLGSQRRPCGHGQGARLNNDTYGRAHGAHHAMCASDTSWRPEPARAFKRRTRLVEQTNERMFPR